jgi:signal transduction histidine kinase
MDETLPLPLSQRVSPRQWLQLDVAVAVVLATASIVPTIVGRDDRGLAGGGWDAARCAIIVIACAALPFRRRYPTWALAVVGTATVSLVALGGRGPTLLTLVLAIYTVASTSERWRSLRAAAVVIVGVALGSVIAAGGPEWGGVVSAPPVVLVGWLAGENTRTRRAYVRGVAERAEERERQREERSRSAVIDERLRIARELHDVVAHTMSVVAVRSGVARMVLDTQPEEARQALEIIETTSRRALQEMRLLVGVLRDGDVIGELAPAPGLAALDQLVREVGEAGVVVDLHIEGDERPLPGGVDVSAFRIAQEALTNVVRHARPARAQLALRYRAGEVEIEVTDDGGGRYPMAAASAGDAGGHGLVGMRERVALFGGTFTSGPSGSGYRVYALLPTAEISP